MKAVVSSVQLLVIFAACLIAGLGAGIFAAPGSSPVEPRVIPLDMAMEESAGGLVAADLNSDRRIDFVVTAPGHIGGYRHDGRRLWLLKTPVRVSAGSSENAGLPGHHAPGVQVADIDGDRRDELLYLDQSSTVHIHDAASGKEKRTVRVPHPDGAERWEHMIVASFRGNGDRDLLLQATNASGYRMGHYISAYPIEKLDGPPLWQTDRYVGCAHNGARVADLDGDGRDEVLGSTIIRSDGTVKEVFTHRGHLDSIFVYDVRPDVPGLEVVTLEEGGGNHVFMFNADRVLFQTHHRNQEPQNAAVGEFDPALPGLEIWLIRDYEMDAVAPRGWTASGVEVIAPSQWSGERVQLAAAKERHESGDVGLFEPVSGRFVLHLPEKADRIYVADVSGDWREEILVVNGRELHVYENPARNPRPKQPRLWEQPHYRRSKMTWNYYSP
jgi:hypothetical protein